MTAEATPSADSTMGATSLFISVYSLTGSGSPETPKIWIGNWEGSYLKTVGVCSVGSLGKSLWARSTNCSTSMAPWPTSVPQRNCTRTTELPSCVEELTRYMLGAEETASSMGRVTCASISSGATLGHVVTTATVGRETAGSRSMGSLVRQTAPSSTSARMRIVTATGRVTEKRAKFMRM